MRIQRKCTKLKALSELEAYPNFKTYETFTTRVTSLLLLVIYFTKMNIFFIEKIMKYSLNFQMLILQYRIQEKKNQNRFLSNEKLPLRCLEMYRIERN